LLSEASRMVLMHDIYENIDFRYPLASGATQYDFNAANTKTVFRGKEPLEMVYPAMKIDFHPVIAQEYRCMGAYYSTYSGANVYANADLEPITITAYYHQQNSGASNTNYHGKPLADDIIRRVKNRVKRYWPSILRNMEASLKPGLGFPIRDISNMQEGTERQAFEMDFYIVSTDKWDLLIDPENYTSGVWFTDAVVSGQSQSAYEAGYPYSKYHTISGLTNLVT